MSQVRINLLTKEFRGDQDTFVLQIIKWVSIGLAAVMIILGAMQFVRNMTSASELKSLKVELEISNKKVNAIKPIISLDESIKKQQAIIQALKKTQLSKGSIMTSIQDKTPAGISFQNFSINAGNGDISLNANTVNDVEKFIDTLRQDKLISGVELKSINQEAGKPVTASVTFTINKGVPSK